jgi:hypothetical protein
LGIRKPAFPVKIGFRGRIENAPVGMQLELDQTQARAIAEKLENILLELDVINANTAAIHIDVAIISVCEKYKLSRLYHPRR